MRDATRRPSILNAGPASAGEANSRVVQLQCKNSPCLVLVEPSAAILDGSTVTVVAGGGLSNNSRSSDSTGWTSSLTEIDKGASK